MDSSGFFIVQKIPLYKKDAPYQKFSNGLLLTNYKIQFEFYKKLHTSKKVMKIWHKLWQSIINSNYLKNKEMSLIKT